MKLLKGYNHSYVKHFLKPIMCFPFPPNFGFIMEKGGDSLGSLLKTEKAVAKFVGAKYAVAISSWTSGLHLANLALGIKNGDKVITSPITFVATSNSIIYCCNNFCNLFKFLGTIPSL